MRSKLAISVKLQIHVKLVAVGRVACFKSQCVVVEDKLHHKNIMLASREFHYTHIGCDSQGKG